MKGVQCYELFGVIELKNHVCFFMLILQSPQKFHMSMEVSMITLIRNVFIECY